MFKKFRAKKEARKLSTGYKKESKNENDFIFLTNETKNSRKKGYVASLIVASDRQVKVTLFEKVLKIVIYFVLRLVIRPKYWKNQTKTYEIIDKTYEKIISADFVYIPASIAFYLIMAFMPILSVVTLVNSIEVLHPILALRSTNKTALTLILGDFIPGMDVLLNQMSSITSSSTVSHVGAWTAIIIAVVGSTLIASNGFIKIMLTLSHIYGYKNINNYFVNKLRGFGAVLLLTFYIIVALVVNIAVVHGLDYSNLSSAMKQFIRYVFLIFGLFILMFLGFAAMFRFTPRFKTRVKWIIPGALLASLPSSLFLSVFGTVASIWDYDKFGAIGSIMYISIAMLVVSYFLVIGIMVNASYHKTFIGKVEKKVRIWQ